MTPRQAARTHCANYQPGGSCLGIALRDDLSMYRFRKEDLPCVFLQEGGCEGCPFFEQTVLPQVPATVAEEYRKSLPTSVATSVQPQHSATKLCLDCRKREVRPRQKYCAQCARKKKRESNRDHIWRKRHHDVGKRKNSPIRAEALAKPQKQTRYDDPKTPFSPSSFPTDEERRQPSEPNGKLHEHTGNN